MLDRFAVHNGGLELLHNSTVNGVALAPCLSQGPLSPGLDWSRGNPARWMYSQSLLL